MIADNYFNLIGFKDNNKDYIIGDLCINPSDNSIVCYTCSSPSTWVPIATTDTIYTSSKTKIKIELTEPKICKCCGAPLHNNICDYCGVEYNYKEI